MSIKNEGNNKFNCIILIVQSIRSLYCSCHSFDSNRLIEEISAKQLHSSLRVRFGRMESAYRAWLRAMKEELIPQYVDKLNRELQMALGTAKWQVGFSRVQFDAVLVYSF